MPIIDERYAGQIKSHEQEAQAKIDAIFADPKLESLTQQFGAPGFANAPVPERVASFKEFTNANWDFRNGKERWEAEPFKPTDEQAAQIFDVARKFGEYNMVDSTKPRYDSYDFVTILGAGNDGPLFRVRYAKEQIDKLASKPPYMILLGSSREVTDPERKSTDAYALGAKTEYDLMNAAVEKEYGVTFQDEETIELKNIDSRIMSESDKSFWKVRRYVTADGMQILSVSAPQIEGTTRSNTADTYRFMREVVGKGMLEGKRVLNVTHAIYTPFQDLDARRHVGIPMGADIDTIGFKADYYKPLTRKPDQLLQEMNSAANSAQFLQESLQELQHDNLETEQPADYSDELTRSSPHISEAEGVGRAEDMQAEISAINRNLKDYDPEHSDALYQGLVKQALGRQAAERDARTDELTELGNRKMFREKLAELLANTPEEDRRKIKVISFDLDDFKGVNDAYGHPVGDEALRSFAVILQTVIPVYRKGEVLARTGGDEFNAALIGEDADMEGYEKRIREGVARVAEIVNWRSLGVSIGRAGYREPGHETETVENFLQRVDAKLYEDKRQKDSRGGEVEN